MIDLVSGHDVPLRRTGNFWLCLVSMVAGIIFCINIVVLYFTIQESVQTHRVLIRVEKMLYDEVTSSIHPYHEQDGIGLIQ